MKPLLYAELAPWYRLVDPPEDHGIETAFYAQCLADAATGDARTLLELGAGAGHNASHLKGRFRCTLVEPSESMRALSVELNPECEHAPGDMRDVRLGRTFDAVLVHDAVCYMLTEEDLRAAATTAFVHTRPGGAALFVPDCTRETFAEQTEQHGGDDGARSVRYVMWTWDPEPADGTYRVDFAFLLREGDHVRAVHDTHLEGLFPRATWQAVLASAGFDVALVHGTDAENFAPDMFLCRRPR